MSCAYEEQGPPGPPGNVLSVVASTEEVDAAAIAAAGEWIAVSDDRTITPVACTGGAPTVANVDTIRFNGATGTSLAIDERDGAFSPGATDEGEGTSEIEFTLDWEDGGFLAVNGQLGSRTSLGATPGGLGLDLMGGGAPPDVDAALTNVSSVVVRGSAEGDTLSALGESPPFSGPFERDVALEGKGGSDRLRGGALEDDLIGGKGADRINARDGERDQVDCGRGKDRVKADKRDRLHGCERVRL